MLLLRVNKVRKTKRQMAQKWKKKFDRPRNRNKWENILIAKEANWAIKMRVRSMLKSRNLINCYDWLSILFLCVHSKLAIEIFFHFYLFYSLLISILFFFSFSSLSHLRDLLDNFIVYEPHDDEGKKKQNKKKLFRNDCWSAHITSMRRKYLKRRKRNQIYEKKNL